MIDEKDIIVVGHCNKGVAEISKAIHDAAIETDETLIVVDSEPISAAIPLIYPHIIEAMKIKNEIEHEVEHMDWKKYGNPWDHRKKWKKRK